MLLLLSHVSLGSYQFLSLPLPYLALAKLLCLESKFPPVSAGVSIITLSSVLKVGHLFKSTALYSRARSGSQSSAPLVSPGT